MRLTALVAAALVAAPVVAAPALAQDGGPDRRYVVQFAAGTSTAEGAAEVRARGGAVERELQHVFRGTIARMSERTAAALRSNPRVARVEADGPVTTTQTPWGLDRVDQRTLPLSGTFDHTSTGKGVTAYVVDTGIRADHVDLAGRVRPTGYTAISDGQGTNDCNGHGTHVAGTVGGTTHGVAKAVELVPVRVLGCDGRGTMSGIVAGLDWVIRDHLAGVPAVANLSLGGGAYATLDDAVQSAVVDGVTVVAAAGNSNVDACTTSPARAASALTVGATTSTDARASFSNWGTCLDVFAPGAGIASAWHSSPTAVNTISGTSMAAPHVAGAVAALLEREPALQPAAVAERLTTSATGALVSDAGTGSPNRLLWADPAVPAPTAPAPTAPAPTPVEPTPTEPAPTTPTATAPAAPTGVSATAGRKAATVTWTRGADGGSPLTGQTIRVFKGKSLFGTASVSATATSATIGGLAAGTSYTFRVVATNAVGSSPESLPSNAVTPTR